MKCTNLDLFKYFPLQYLWVVHNSEKSSVSLRSTTYVLDIWQFGFFCSLRKIDKISPLGKVINLEDIAHFNKETVNKPKLTKCEDPSSSTGF